ncbi:MAG: hypothetical protein R3F19_18185 [Verrucomicrobiales bacterium]
MCEVVRAIAKECISDENLNVIFSAFDKMECALIKANSIQSSLKAIFENSENEGKFCSNILKYHDRIATLGGPASRCPSFARLLAFIQNNSPTSAIGLQEKMIQKISDEWMLITTGWEKVRIGFKAVQILAKSSPELARRILQDTEDLRGQVIFDSQDSARSYIECVRLTVRALAGLARRKEYADGDMELVKGLIERIPCPVNQLALSSEIATRFYLQGDQAKCAEITNQIIKPALAQQFADDRDAYNTVVMTVAPALHCAHPASAIQLIKSLPSSYSDSAFWDICDFIIKSKISFDEYDEHAKAKESMTYEKVLDVISVLENFSSDWRLCDAIEALVSGIGTKRFKSQFNNIQIADVNARINEIVARKIPNQKYIKHDGYKIIIEALMLKLNGAKDGWLELLEQARKIPNYADATLVLVSVAAKLPSKDRKLAIATFVEAKARVPSIPFFEDRLHHLEHLAESALAVDKQLSKDCIKDAWLETIPLDQSGLPHARTRLIDFAHRVDPEFASSLASEIGADPGRDYARREANERIELLKAKQELSSGSSKESHGSDDPDRCVEVARMMLSGLNSERVNSLHLDKVRPYIGQAGRISLDDSYFVFAWVMENAVRRFSNQHNSASILRPIYESARLASELTFKIAARKRAVVDSGFSVARSSNWGSSLVRPGERDIAIALICEWATEAKDFIKITDPFFGLEELNLVKRIREINQEIPIHIVTSRKYQNDMGVEQPWEDAYSTYWRISVSDSDPGPVTITMIGSASSGSHPIHDRWCLSGRSGLRLGTSINSIGTLKSSEISALEEVDCQNLLGELERWLRGTKDHDSGEKIKRTTFEL